MEVQLKWDTSAFLNGVALGGLGYAGASRIQRIPLVRRPWHLIGSMIGMGLFTLAFGNYQEATTKALARQKKLYVQRLREQTADGSPMPVNAKDLYTDIVRELERKGEIVNGEIVQEVFVSEEKSQ